MMVIHEIKQADKDINHGKMIIVPICNFTLTELSDFSVQEPDQPDRNYRPRQELHVLIR